MKIRNIPFGYSYLDGKKVIETNESNIVKEIFNKYLIGESLNDIAESLNNRQIEYMTGVIAWNKGRLRHLLEDKRYIGENGYPYIIDEGTFKKANQLKYIKNTQKNTDIGMAIGADNVDDSRLDIEIRIAKIDSEVNKMLNAISSESVENFDEQRITILLNEKSKLQQQLAECADTEQKQRIAQSRLDNIYTIIEGLKNHPLDYNDELIRQILARVVVESKDKIRVIFIGGLEVEQRL